jgi:SAM-dependent methyltransferase
MRTDAAARFGSASRRGAGGSAQVREEFNRLLGLFPADLPGVQAYVDRSRARLWGTLQHLPHGGGEGRLLDVGGMRGLLGPAYLDLWGYHDVTIVEMDAQGPGIIRRRDGTGREYAFRWVRCNIEVEPLPFPDASFETVVCMEVLEHLLFDPAFAVHEINRVLVPGGHLLLSVPNATSDSCLTYLVNGAQPGFLRQYLCDALRSGERKLDTVYDMGHYHEYTRMELEALAASRGFEVVELLGLSPLPPLLGGFRFRLLPWLVRLMFPRSRRIRQDIIVALLEKKVGRQLDQWPVRYPSPLYKSLSEEAAAYLQRR